LELGVSDSAYEPPVIVDRGSLRALTQSHTLLAASQFGQVAAGFAASVINPPGGTPQGPPESVIVPGPTGGGGSAPQTIVSVPTPKHHPQGLSIPHEDAGVGGTSGGGGSGGTLPFTGYAVLLTAGIGVVFASTGAKLRRVVRRSH
jgi:hypothetical protein